MYLVVFRQSQAVLLQKIKPRRLPRSFQFTSHQAPYYSTRRLINTTQNVVIECKNNMCFRKTAVSLIAHFRLEQRTPVYRTVYVDVLGIALVFFMELHLRISSWK